MTLAQRVQQTYEIEQSAMELINLNTTLRSNVIAQDGNDVLIPASIINQVLRTNARIAKELTEHAMKELNGGSQ